MKSAILILSLVCPAVYAADSQGIAYYNAGFPESAKVLLLKDMNTGSAGNAETCYYLGNIYFGENKVDSAAYYYNKGLSLEAENPCCQIGLAKLQIKNNPTGAADQFDHILKGKNKKNPDILVAVGRAYLDNKQPDKALEYAELAKKQNSKSAAAYTLEGDILFSKKDIGNACSRYEQAIYFDPSCKEAYIKYARAYSGVNSELAIEMLQKLKAQDPSFLLTDKELADVYYASGQYRKAIEAYDSYLQSGFCSDADFAKYATTLYLAKDYTRSLKMAEQGLKKNPDNLLLKRLLMYDDFELKKYAEGLVAAEKFFDKPINPDYVYLDHLYYGRLLKANRQMDKSVSELEAALKMDATKIEIWKEISETYEKMDNYDKAIAAYSSYMEALGQKAEVADLFSLGRLYYYAGSELDTVPDNQDKKQEVLAKADSIFALVAEKVPDNYLGNFWRARVNSLLDPETTAGLAKPYYEAALAILAEKPDTNKSLQVECNSYLGYYYFVKNDFPESKVYWNKILEIDPTNETAQKALAGIK